MACEQTGDEYRDEHISKERLRLFATRRIPIVSWNCAGPTNRWLEHITRAIVASEFTRTWKRRSVKKGSRTEEAAAVRSASHSRRGAGLDGLDRPKRPGRDRARRRANGSRPGD